MPLREFLGALALLAFGCAQSHDDAPAPSFYALVTEYDQLRDELWLEAPVHDAVVAIPPLAKKIEGERWRIEDVVCTIQEKTGRRLTFSCSRPHLARLCGEPRIGEGYYVQFVVLSCEVKGKRM